MTNTSLGLCAWESFQSPLEIKVGRDMSNYKTITEVVQQFQSPLEIKVGRDATVKWFDGKKDACFSLRWRLRSVATRASDHKVNAIEVCFSLRWRLRSVATRYNMTDTGQFTGAFQSPLEIKTGRDSVGAILECLESEGFQSPMEINVGRDSLNRRLRMPVLHCFSLQWRLRPVANNTNSVLIGIGNFGTFQSPMEIKTGRDTERSSSRMAPIRSCFSLHWRLRLVATQDKAGGIIPLDFEFQSPLEIEHGRDVTASIPDECTLPSAFRSPLEIVVSRDLCAQDPPVHLIPQFQSPLEIVVGRDASVRGRDHANWTSRFSPHWRLRSVATSHPQVRTERGSFSFSLHWRLWLVATPADIRAQISALVKFQPPLEILAGRDS